MRMWYLFPFIPCIKYPSIKGRREKLPRLNKLGTGAWEKMKERTKSKIKDIARDLIRLYSQRKQEKRILV